MRRKEISWEFDGNCIRCLSHCIDRDGYPHISRKGKHMTIARHILFRRYGDQPTSIVTRHTCDHTWCIHPHHIIPGTHQDNVADRVLRGRTAIRNGADNSHSKLSEDNVRTIRTLSSEGFTQATIARMFKIHQSNVHLILSNKTWGHL